MKRIYLLSTLLSLGALSVGFAASPKPAATAKRTVQYNRDVRPILSENCFACHGPDSGTRMAGLRLDTEQGAKALRAGGHAAVVPGHPTKSAAIARVTTKNAALVMPPPQTGKKLKPHEVQILRDWIAQGAKWQDHWAYLPVVRTAPPAPKNPAWARGAIDRFLLARMERGGVKPSPEADRPTLIRRLSLDLTGLPPRPEAVRAFLLDKRADAYERLVDSLLASPHYGERMAQTWLDQVRYADTTGYHGDQNVSVWPYRDYVIDAFNANKPFDQFTREQLAGDLLPKGGDAALIASAYNRLGMMSTEGGIQDKEYRAKYATDRVKNLSTVWMGATVACAECHDHKFDPYAQKDFYRIAAFFADLNEKGFYDGGFDRGDWGPSRKFPNAAQKARLARLDADVAAAKKALDGPTGDALVGGRARWEADVRALDAAKTLGWHGAVPTQASSSGGSTLTVQPDGVVTVSGKLPAADTYIVSLPAERERIAAIRLEALPDDALPGNSVARSGHYFVLSEFEVAAQKGDAAPRPVKLASVIVNRDDEGFPAHAAIDGRADTGWAQVHSHAGGRTAVFRLAEPLAGGPDTKLVVRIRHETKPRLAIGKFKLSLAGVVGADLGGQALPDDVLAAIRKDAAARTPDEANRVAGHYRAAVAPELAVARRNVARLEAERSLLNGRIPTTLVSEVTPSPRVVRLLPRGNWMDDSGEIVEPGVPHFLKQVSKKGRATRLDLANWLVSKDNPLTARVFVNRLWHQFYGVGLVKNVDDFGAQGEAPFHPELLDWLASEFVRSGWDVKHVVRLMVTSRAYRQRSDATPARLARDPFNRLVARQTPVRLDAEFVRDVALAASGLLSPKRGGPSVHPYQPSGYLAPLNFPRREWADDAGESLYRRGLYTHWQRSFLHPSLLAFDAPTREEGTCTRTVSNTPMQALVLMNDPVFVEAARAFAARIVRDGGKTVDARLAYAYGRALSRAPKAEEMALLRRLYHQQRARYGKDREAAEKLIRVGASPVASGIDPVELAAWTSVARALLNLHETITRS